jgi:outer membrane protein TolC
MLMALDRHRDLRARRLQPVIAGALEDLERGAFDPEVFAEAGYDEERTRESSRSTGEEFDVSASGARVGGGIRQTLPSGTAVEAALDQERSASNRSPEQQTARVGVEVTQQLLRGAGPSVNLVRVRQAELEVHASLHELRRFTEVLLADTLTAYWDLVLARQEIAIFEESLRVARQGLREIEERIAVGVLPDSEAAAARVEAALREQALIDARSDLEARRLRLLRLLDPEGDGRLDRPVEAVSSPDLDPEPIEDLGDRVALALRMRPDLGEARVRLEQGRLETVLTRDGRMPRLELFLSLGATGYGETFLDSFAEIDGRTWDAEAGLRLEMTLGDRAARARDVVARVDRRRARLALQNLERAVRLEVRLAANEVERARLRIRATRTTRGLQERTVEAEEERFRVGTSTAFLVARARRDLLAARIAEVESVIGYRRARIRLALAEGSLLERHGVRLDEGS